MNKFRIISLISILLVSYGCASLVRMKHTLQGVEKVTVAELRVIITEKDTNLLDVRDPPDWARSSVKIPTAIRENPNETARWAQKYDKDRKLIVYCA